MKPPAALQLGPQRRPAIVKFQTAALEGRVDGRKSRHSSGPVGNFGLQNNIRNAPDGIPDPLHATIG